jgi:hypothetical protein
MDLINYIYQIKNGDKQLAKELYVAGFTENINDLVNLPAANLNEIKDCFSISLSIDIDGEKLSRKIRYIKRQIEHDNYIDELISMGMSFKQGHKYLGISRNEYFNKRNMTDLKFNDNKLKDNDIELIYSSFQLNKEKCRDHLTVLKKTYLDVHEKKGLNVSLKKIHEVCCEHD